MFFTICLRLSVFHFLTFVRLVDTEPLHSPMMDCNATANQQLVSHEEYTHDFDELEGSQQSVMKNYTKEKQPSPKHTENDAVVNLVKNAVNDPIDNQVVNSENSEVGNAIYESMDEPVEYHHIEMCSGTKLQRLNLLSINLDIKILNHEYIPKRSECTPFKCSQCDKCFQMKRSLLQHVLTHSPNKPFQCSKCDRSFRLKSHLQGHIPTHSRKKPFHCSICEKRFRLRSHLQQHFYMHSENKPYKCKDCGRDFNLRNNLEQHLKTHSQKGRTVWRLWSIVMVLLTDT